MQAAGVRTPPYWFDAAERTAASSSRSRPPASATNPGVPPSARAPDAPRGRGGRVRGRFIFGRIGRAWYSNGCPRRRRAVRCDAGGRSASRRLRDAAAAPDVGEIDRLPAQFVQVARCKDLRPAMSSRGDPGGQDADYRYVSPLQPDGLQDPTGCATTSAGGPIAAQFEAGRPGRVRADPAGDAALDDVLVLEAIVKNDNDAVLNSLEMNSRFARSHPTYAMMLRTCSACPSLAHALRRSTVARAFRRPSWPATSKRRHRFAMR